MNQNNKHISSQISESNTRLIADQIMLNLEQRNNTITKNDGQDRLYEIENEVKNLKNMFLNNK